MKSVKLQDTELTYKNQLFIYTNDELFEKKIKKLISIYISIKNKILGISLTKEVKCLYSENYKRYLRSSKWKNIPCS